MDMIGKGSKPVVYKSNIRLKFYSTIIEASEIKVNRVFTKITDDGTVVVYGEYIIYLLYSYFNSLKQKIYMTEAQTIKFSEAVSCHLPAHADFESFQAEASFDPRITFERASSSTWNIEVEGQIDVFVYGNKEELLAQISTETGEPPKNDATVMRLNDTGLTVKELLEMDTQMIEKLSSGSKAAAAVKNPDTPDSSEKQNENNNENAEIESN